MKKVIIGSYAEESITVSENNTAVSAGSGSLRVLGTPFLIALMEKAACRAAEPFLEEGETTVGISVCITHGKASIAGETVTAKAQITGAEGRKIVYSVTAQNEKGETVGGGTIERFTVIAEKFMKKAAEARGN